MTYTFDDLKSDVKKEAEALRVHATEEERGRLDIKKFERRHYDGCIYGMATGDCHSRRSVSLIQLCTPRYFKEEIFLDVDRHGIDGILKNANGTTVEDLFDARAGNLFFANVHYSAIEAYILLPEAENANLIAFLRGETETLDL